MDMLLNKMKNIVTLWLVRKPINIKQHSDDIVQEICVSIMEKGYGLDSPEVGDTIERINRNPKIFLRQSKAEIIQQLGIEKGAIAGCFRAVLQKFFDDRKFGEDRGRLINKKEIVFSSLLSKTDDNDNEDFEEKLNKYNQRRIKGVKKSND